MDSLEQKLREEAEARVAFKRHFKIYVIITLLIWAIWYLFRARFGYYDGYWPIYSTLGWGFGVFMHYSGVYGNSESKIDQEVEKLKKERGLD
jgi:hypothetical protein